MIDFSSFLNRVEQCELKRFRSVFEQCLDSGLDPKNNRDLHLWYEVLDALPVRQAQAVNLSDGVFIGDAAEIDATTRSHIEKALRSAMPWRKGPIDIFGIHIDTEWRSDWKWERVKPHIRSLKNRRVLDVGCGNGYYGLRMHGEEAQWVVGVDPTTRFVVQYFMLKHFLGELSVDIIPATLEELPASMEFFDTCFSMGVLYHRPSPLDHLRQLRDTLVPGGELVLETLVVDGPLGYSLVPQDRYAMMRNVWFLPSVPTLESWLKKCGFDHVRCVDINVTTLQEQRQTEWMTFHSLENFLDPDNPGLTVEGHPAPTRATFVATKR